MKQIIYLFIGLLILSACEQEKETKQDSNQKPNSITTIEFNETDIDLGTMVQGEVVECVYKYKNTGKNNLKILRVNASCGCTTPEYSKEFTEPGNEGEIKVKFNSAGRSGKQSKTLRVYSNTAPTETVLHFTAEIEMN